jgi:hypothetical protein
MFARLAQVVFTLTRLPDVDGVVFSLDGTPVTTFSSEGIELDGLQSREGYYDHLPPVFVDSPAWGEPVTSPVAVSGLSNVFEATSQVMLTDDDGATLFEDHVMASCGTGCWGEWSVAENPVRGGISGRSPLAGLREKRHDRNDESLGCRRAAPDRRGNWPGKGGELNGTEGMVSNVRPRQGMASRLPPPSRLPRTAS